MVTRMLHRNIEVENRVDDARIERLSGVIDQVKVTRKKAAEDAAVHAGKVARKVRNVREAVESMIEAEAGEDLARTDALLTGLYKFLNEVAGEDGFIDAPISQLARRVSKNLGFTPVWKAWARKDWAKAERYVVGSPYGLVPRIVRDKGGRYSFSSQRLAARETGPP